MLNVDFRDRLDRSVVWLETAKKIWYVFWLIEKDILAFTYECLQESLSNQKILRTIFGNEFDEFLNKLNKHIDRVENFLNAPGGYESPRQILAQIEGEYSEFLNNRKWVNILTILRTYNSAEKDDGSPATNENGVIPEISRLEHSFSNTHAELERRIKEAYFAQKESDEQLHRLIELENERSKRATEQAVNTVRHSFEDTKIENLNSAKLFLKSRSVAYIVLICTILIPAFALLIQFLHEFWLHWWNNCWTWYEVLRAATVVIWKIDPKVALGFYSLLVIAAYLNVHFATKNYYHRLSEADFYGNRTAISDSYEFFASSVNMSESSRATIIWELVKRVFEPNDTKQFDTSDLTTPIAELIKTIKKE